MSSMKVSSSLVSALNRYSAFNPSPLSLEKLLLFGREATERQSFTFLRKELPVRLANILTEIHHLPEAIIQVPSIQRVDSWYTTTFQEILNFETVSENDSLVLKKFNEALHTMLARHSSVVETMAQGILEMREKHKNDANFRDLDQYMQYFLNRFYTSRISVRMLINQHTLLFGDSHKQGKNRIGGIDPCCDVPSIVHDAYDNARYLCDQYYMDAPPVEFYLKDATSKTARGATDVDRLEIVYVPSHLYHIVFELLKNSMRAVMESHGEDADSYPPIKVMVVKGEQDVTIRLSDRGGGMPRSVLPLLFNYMYSTAPRPEPESEQLQGSAPLAGYGYGLPLSKLYARYFQGDILLNSIEGYGTDAYIYLKTLSSEANELLPFFNKTSTKFYKSQPPRNDWSGPVPGQTQ